jgi:hypothetical protein
MYIAIRSIIRLFSIFWGHWIYFMDNCYIFSPFGISYQEKSLATLHTLISRAQWLVNVFALPLNLHSWMGSGQVALCDTRLECLCEKNVTHESARKKRVLENIAPLNCGTPRFGFSGLKREKNSFFRSLKVVVPQLHMHYKVWNFPTAFCTHKGNNKLLETVVIF